MDRPEGDDSGGAWFARVGRWVAILAVIGLILPMVVTLFVSRGGNQAAPAQSVPLRTRAKVTGVIDGNTIRVDIAGQPAVVRYIGVAAPPVGDPLHDASVAVNERWVIGEDVLLEADEAGEDREGRLLRYVWIREVMVNAVLIAAGLGRNVNRPPNTRYSSAFVEIERNARENGLGMWINEESNA